MSLVYSCLSFVIIALAARWLIVSSSLQKAKQIAGTTYFKGSVLIRALFGIAFPVFLYGTIAVAFSQSARSDWWVSVILGSVVVGIILGWPEQIITNSDGIMQSRILGIGWRMIQWTEVDYATENPTSGGIDVVPKVGRKIVHSPMHVGHDEFLAIVKSHCRMF